MTLIVIIPAKDGVAIGSDTQLTSGLTRSVCDKIKEFNSRCLWAGSGDLSFIQRVEERIATLDKKQPLISLRDQIGFQVNQAHANLLQLNIATPFYQGNPQLLLQLHHGTFVFAEYSDKPTIIQVNSNGIPEIIDRPYAIGNGDIFAFALMHKYQYFDFDLKTAAIVTYKVIDEAIEVGSYGLSHPIDIWTINKDGIKEFENDDYENVFQKADKLTTGEVDLLEQIASQDEIVENKDP